MGEEGVNLERESESDVCGGRGGCFVMDTPDRKQFTSPASKFEDSPVFNYLNSLSPIKPLKSIHITQTFNSLTFSSPPSVFTSPHVSSLKDSTFLRRHQDSDPSKPKFSYNHGDKGDKSEEATEVTHNSEQQQSYDPGFIAGESSALPVYESSDAVALPQTLSAESVSPDRSRTSRLCIENKFVPGLAVSSSDLLPYAQVDSGKESLGEDVHVEGTSLINEVKGASGCDWENLFSDEGDLILFNTPNESKSLMHPGQISLEHGTSFCTSLTGDLQNSQAVNTIGSSQQHETDNNSPLVDGRHDMKEVKNQDILVSCSNSLAGDISEKVNDQIASNLHRGMRRRCLVFEMVGSRRKRLDDASDCVSTVLSQSIDNAASNDKHVLSLNSGNDNPRRILHGIGLHLNALAATSVDHRVMRHEASASGEQPISVSGPSAYFNLSNSQQISNNSFTASLDRDVCPVEDGAPIAEDAAQGSGYMVNEMLNHRSPKKKRRRSDNDGESEACKRCNCKKSKCLKLYCECFAAGVYCVEPCSCQECFNTPIHEDTVLATRKLIESRNPLAFAPKVIRNSDSMIEIGEESSNTPASARHKRGCNCKKSGCLKKYCECYQGGVGCSINCRCEGCKNAFGRKDGSEIELEDDEAEKIDDLEGRAVNRNLKITTMVNDVEQNTNFALPATPLQFGRQSIQPFSSKSKKPPRSSFLSIEGSSCGIFGTPRFGKLNNLPPQAKFQNDQKDEMPEILQQNASPNSSVKSASPNSKRVSPPHSNIGLSPGRRSNRKLILQSIPSFPSLTSKN